MTCEKLRAIKFARKLKLQSRLARDKSRGSIDAQVFRHLDFLDIETSVSIFSELQKQHIWEIETDSREACTHKVSHSISGFIAEIENFYSRSASQFGFCFPLEWEVYGAFVIDSNFLVENLDKIMFIFNDELKFYTPDFFNVLQLRGDRSGTGLLLNELKLTAMGNEFGQFKNTSFNS